MVVLKGGKCPSDSLSLTNRVILHPHDLAALGNPRHILCAPQGTAGRYLFTAEANDANTQVITPH